MSDFSPFEQASRARIEPAYLNQQQAADYLNITVQFLLKLEKQGCDTGKTKLGRAARYSRSALDRLMSTGWESPKNQ